MDIRLSTGNYGYNVILMVTRVLQTLVITNNSRCQNI